MEQEYPGGLGMEIPCTADTLRPLFTYENGATYHGSWWETSFFNICHVFFSSNPPENERRLGNNGSLRQDGGVATWSRRTGPDDSAPMIWSMPGTSASLFFKCCVKFTYFNEKHGELMKNMENS
jgi:hypothetical protein